ncbi:MAG TPA: lipid-A-disaccharide synthase [Alphaproteobacteria bacterium]|jgi:lipid-A-disaccharide synthase
MSAPLRIFLIAGEPSGDQLGGHIMKAIRRRAAETGRTVEFAGLGGDAMAEEGLTSLFPTSDLAIFGIVEVIPHAPRIFRRVRETVAAIRAFKPDVVLSIDVPAFAFRVLKRVKDDGVPLVHCVAPTVWAWRPGRAKVIAGFLDHLLALLPFEPPYFERVGLPTTFIGHPVVEAGFMTAEVREARGVAFRDRHGIPPGADLLCVLPGSRRSEVTRLLPVFGETLQRLAPLFPGLQVVVPTVSHVAETVRAAVAAWPLPVTLVTGNEEKFSAFAASNAALAASGTVVLELAVTGCPTVMAYKVSGLTAWIVRRMVKVQYATLPNLILDRGLVPEFIQERCNPTALAEAVGHLLLDEEARREQVEGGAEVARRLGAGGPAPSEVAADVVLEHAARSAS